MPQAVFSFRVSTGFVAEFASGPWLGCFLVLLAAAGVFAIGMHTVVSTLINWFL